MGPEAADMDLVVGPTGPAVGATVLQRAHTGLEAVAMVQAVGQMDPQLLPHLADASNVERCGQGCLLLLICLSPLAGSWKPS